MNSTLKNKPIGILGGTFDPIHHGHLRLALELYERLDLKEVRLVPAAQPPLRDTPTTRAQHRLEMVKAAIVGVPGLQVDNRELHRPTPSYTVDTLRSLRDDYPTQPLCLILGMDAFLKLPQWYRWEELITLAHLVVVHRYHQSLPKVRVLSDFLNTYQTHEPNQLHQQMAGTVFLSEIPMLNISATQIRDLLAEGRNPCYLLPSGVLDIIYKYQLYR